MDTEDEYCLDTINYEKKRVIFLEEIRQIKAKKRPELRGKEGDKFINGRVKEAIQNPHFVYEDYSHPNDRQVHYILEFSINDTSRYTKVVVSKNENPLHVITAYRPDYIKEKGKTKLLYGEDR